MPNRHLLWNTEGQVAGQSGADSLPVSEKRKAASNPWEARRGLCSMARRDSVSYCLSMLFAPHGFGYILHRDDFAPHHLLRDDAVAQVVPEIALAAQVQRFEGNESGGILDVENDVAGRDGLEARGRDKPQNHLFALAVVEDREVDVLVFAVSEFEGNGIGPGREEQFGHLLLVAHFPPGVAELQRDAHVVGLLSQTGLGELGRCGDERVEVEVSGLGHLLDVAVAGQVPGIVGQLEEPAPHVVELVDDLLIGLGNIVNEQFDVGVIAPRVVAVLGAEQLGQQRSGRGEQCLGIHVATDDTRQVGEPLCYRRGGEERVVKIDFTRNDRFVRLFGLGCFEFRDILQVMEKVGIVGRLVIAVGYTFQANLFAFLNNTINLLVFDFVQFGRDQFTLLIALAGFGQRLGVNEAPGNVYTERNFVCHDSFYF